MADQVMLETRLPEAVNDRLAEIARQDGRSKAVLTADMLRHCVIDHPQWTTDAAEDMRLAREGARVLRETVAPSPLAPESGRAEPQPGLVLARGCGGVAGWGPGAGCRGAGGSSA